MFGLGILLLGTHYANETREQRYSEKQLMVAEDEGMICRPVPPDPRFVSPVQWFLPDPRPFELVEVLPFKEPNKELLDWIAGFTITEQRYFDENQGVETCIHGIAVTLRCGQCILEGKQQ